MRRLILTTGIILFFSCSLFPVPCSLTYADKVTFKSPITWRSDGQGTFKFVKNCLQNGVGLAADKSLIYQRSPGTCELAAPYAADGMIAGISASWIFTGQVTMEVSATGNSGDYVRVVNGVPLEWGKFKAGNKLLWRATLAPGSVLSEVRISYMDLSGVVGPWGSPELTGFTRRLPIYIGGQGTGGRGQGTGNSSSSVIARSETTKQSLFNYQIRIKVGEPGSLSIPTDPSRSLSIPINPSQSLSADVVLKSATQSDFADIRFVQKDEVTVLPHYLESVIGSAGQRVGVFWVKIPQLPAEGHELYLYYGCRGAKDLSNGADVFDFFDDFKNGVPDTALWDASVPGKITAKAYRFNGGILEFKARTDGGTFIYKVIGKGGVFEPGADKELSTDAPGSKESDAPGSKEARDPFKFLNKDALAKGAIELSTLGSVEYYWIRTRQLASPVIAAKAAIQGADSRLPGNDSEAEAISIDTAKTAKAAEEIPNLAEFSDTVVAPDGSLVLADKASEGYYVSPAIHSPFKARIVIPSWEVSGLAGKPVSEIAGSLNPLTIDFSTDDSGKFKDDCETGKYYYASKKDFAEGDTLRWKATLRRTKDEGRGTKEDASLVSHPSSLVNFTLDFRRGKISVIAPNDSEKWAAGSAHSIIWDAVEYDPKYRMKLAYSIDGGKAYSDIAACANTGRYSWLVPESLSTPTDPSRSLSTPTDPSRSLSTPTDSSRSLSIPIDPSQALLISDKCLIRVSDSLNEKVYDVSNSLFSIGQGSEAGITEASLEPGSEVAAGGGEEAGELASKEVEEKPEEEKKTGAQSYDILVKLGSNVSSNPEEDARASFKEGDIVMVRPTGFKWSDTERRSFLIVQADLTEQEAADLTRPREIVTGKDRDGKPITKPGGPRKYRIDLNKQKLLDKKVSALKGLLSSKPVIKRDQIEERR